jgi:nucleoside-diphosphate-sugar epimerase
VLVTGATGFVGGILIKRLHNAGSYNVRAAVRHNNHGLSAGVKAVIVGEIAPNTIWEHALTGLDVVVHLAARTHVIVETAHDPLTEFRRVNVGGTLSLARQAGTAGVRRFIFISSVKANGETTNLGKPYTPDDVPAPADAYGISKLDAENGLRQLARDTGMEVVIIRPPLVYGPQVKGNLLRLLSWIDRELPLPFANVDNRRSLLNVHNLVDLIVSCIKHAEAKGQIFLASDGEDLCTGDLVRRLAAAMGKNPRLFPVPLQLTHSILRLLRRDDLWARLFASLQVSDDRTRTLLGWRPPVSMAEGLDEMGRWYVQSRPAQQ